MSDPETGQPNASEPSPEPVEPTRSSPEASPQKVIVSDERAAGAKTEAKPGSGVAAQTRVVPVDPATRLQTLLVGGGFYLFVGGIIARSSNELAKGWIDQYWPFLIAGYAVVIGVYVLWSYLKGKTIRISEVAKNAMIVFGGIPLIVAGILTISLARPDYRLFAIHSIFILCVCLLPGAMYYVFIVTRKPSILNKYVANLARLGLLSKGPREKENEPLRRRRIESYFQRFEAVYGPLENRQEFLSEMCSLDMGDATSPPVPGTPPIEGPKGPRLGSVFPPSVAAQILLTTVFTGIGFLLVLAPKWTGFFSASDTPAHLVASSTDASGAGNGTGTPTDSAATNLAQADSPEPAGPEPIPPATIQAKRLAVEMLPPILIPEFTPVNMAFLGAYFFNIQMLFHRFLRRDMSVNAYVSASLRMVMAVIGAWVLAVIWGYWFVEAGSGFTFISLLSKGFETLPKGDWPLLIFAFVIGVFPRTLWQLIEAMLKKFPTVSFFLPSVESDQRLSELDGMTIWTETRLDEEDVENVPNMATADMISLLLQTKFPEDRLIKWIDQAILLTYLGPASKKKDNGEPSSRDILASNGITTASELMVAYNDAASDDAKRTALEKLLGDNHSLQIRHIVRYLQEQSTNFNLIAAWRGLIVDKPSRAPMLDVVFAPELSSDVKVVNVIKRQPQSAPQGAPEE